MLLGFKTELRVNNRQRTQLAKHCGVARHAWNWGLALTKNILDHNQANPEGKIKFPTAIDLHRWLVAMVKSENEWYYEVSKCAPQYALRQLAEAWKQAFKKVKKPPRFKKKGKSDSFTVDGALKVESFRVKVPMIGPRASPAHFPRPTTLGELRQTDACAGFVTTKPANINYYRLVLETLWPPEYGIPGPVVPLSRLRQVIDDFRGVGEPYQDVPRRIRELQGEEGFLGVVRFGSGKQTRYQL